MAKSRGSALVDYVLPLALIGIVFGVALFSFAEENVLLKFLANSLNLTIKDGTAILSPQQYTSIDTSQTNTATNDNTSILDQYVNQNDDFIGLSIQLGNYSLQGIPEHFGEFIETSGSAAGTEKLSQLLLQLADQVEAEGQVAEADGIKELATMGHNIAAIERAFEELVLSCQGDQACVYQKGSQLLPKPSDYNETYNSFAADRSYFESIGHEVICWRPTLKAPSPFNQHYQDLMKTSLDDTSKSIITELYWEIGMIAQNVEAGMSFYGDDNYSKDFHDPITGKWQKTNDLPDDPYEIYTGYKPSTLSHLDSALICATSHHYTDTGKKCH